MTPQQTKKQILEEFNKKFNNWIGWSFECTDAETLMIELEQFLSSSLDLYRKSLLESLPKEKKASPFGFSTPHATDIENLRAWDRIQGYNQYRSEVKEILGERNSNAQS